MCGRYTLYMAEEIAVRYSLANKPAVHVDDNYNVAPGQFMPIVVRGDDGRNRMELMKWGFVPAWAKDEKIGYKLINTRAETAFEKPFWRAAVTKHRCLVPARGFYEWQAHPDGKGKTPYYIHPKNVQLFSFAGIWSVWKDPDGNNLKSFSLFTTEPNKEMTRVHNRMPVILHPEDEAAWLDPSLQTEKDIVPFLAPYDDGGLDMYPVSGDVNSPRNNDEHLIHAI